MRKKSLLMGCLAAAILAASGFTTDGGSEYKAAALQGNDEAGRPQVEHLSEALEEPPALPVMAQQAGALSEPEPEPPRGSGMISYNESAQRLSPPQEALLTDYMNAYYTSLALLKEQNFAHLFAEDTAAQLENARAILSVQLAVRAMQKTDLSLSGYSFKLTVQSVTTTESGDVRVRVQEDNVQSFAAYPGVDSKGYDIGHSFTLSFSGGQWRIREHRNMSSVQRLVMGLGRWQPGVRSPAQADSTATPDSAAERLEKLLADARTAVALRESQGSDGGVISFDYAYDRVAAANYAREWVNRRNPEWPSYDRLGGNCQNFTSQAMLAGGIPMDYSSPGQWKWYGDTPNSSFAPYGRSPAWSGVSEFLSYVQSNRGRGMVAVADAPYYSGEVGDVIHMGVGGDWRHTVIITEVIKDESGKTTDYLIASNTMNLLDFPVSAYYYTEQMLIKIYGWNK